jgi:hypothetical protein
MGIHDLTCEFISVNIASICRFDRREQRKAGVGVQILLLLAG